VISIWAARTTSSRTGSPLRRCSRWCPARPPLARRTSSGARWGISP